MVQALELLFDEAADAEIRKRWQHLEDIGIKTPARGNNPPHVTLAVGTTIPTAAREALRAELNRLSFPDLWLSTMGTFPGAGSVLFLGAVVDTEILAVHSAVHDVLAGKVTNPVSSCFPGAWIPHCTLAQGLSADQLATGFAALSPFERVRASIARVVVIDTGHHQVDHLLD